LAGSDGGAEHWIITAKGFKITIGQSPKLIVETFSVARS
jgi:hypothetical protein